MRLLEIEGLRWDELPEELQLALPYCPPEIAHEILRIFRGKVEDLDDELDVIEALSGSIGYPPHSRRKG